MNGFPGADPDGIRTAHTPSGAHNAAYAGDSGTSPRRSGPEDRRRELFGAACDPSRPDLITWLRGYIRQDPVFRNPRTQEAKRWLASLEKEVRAAWKTYEAAWKALGPTWETWEAMWKALDAVEAAGGWRAVEMTLAAEWAHAGAP